MFGPLGLPEVLVILLLALLLFGPRRLPEMGRTIGKALGEFRRATTDLKRSINTEIALEDADERPKYPRNPAARNPQREVAESAQTPAESPPQPAEGTEPRGGTGGGAGERGDGERDSRDKSEGEQGDGEQGDGERRDEVAARG